MNYTILVVEDDETIRNLYNRTLTLLKYQVISAVDGEDAIEKAQTIPDLILLDIMLPKINGIEVLKIIKSNPLTKAIPVLILSNLGQESIIKQAMDNGAIDYLIKLETTPQVVSEKINAILLPTKS